MTTTGETEKKSKTTRDGWGNDNEFLMSCIATSVGLGNIWRFPFAAFKNGGGAFLIPYVVVLTLIGRPLYYMEMALGQFSSGGTIKAFDKLSPVFKGIGYAQVISTTCIASYYCSIMAITLFYFINSFTSEFPWSKCHDSWLNYTESRNLTCVDSMTNVVNVTINTISSSELYFKREVLKDVDNIEDGIGIPDWRLTLLLLFAWLITFLVSIKGVKSSGKASYFLAIFPYVILITLLIRAVTLEGSTDGIYYFIYTDWNRLLDPNVWYAAVTQCFFSLSVGFGSIIMLSSYNSFRHNIRRDALIITTLDTCTSLMSGVIIFGILGNLAFELKADPKDVISSGEGTGLAFISYPEAISKFAAVPWVFGILFFLMFFVLGIGSLCASHGVMNTAIRDAFPNIAPWKVSAFTATACFFIGLLYMTPGGQYVLDLMDHFGGTLVVFICAIMEVIAVCWVYGVDQFCLDVEFMTRRKVSIYWRFCWGVSMPFLLVVIFIYFLANIKPLTYGVYDLEYPLGLTVFGWSIVGIVLIQTGLFLFYYLWNNREYPFKEMIEKTFSREMWQPDEDHIAKEWRQYKADIITARPPKSDFWISDKIRILSGK